MKPIQCKHCNKVISPAEIIIGEPEAIRLGKTVQKMARHLESRANEEASKGVHSANGKPFTPGPHHAAAIQLQMIVQGISEYAVAQHFNLSDDLEQAVEAGRHSIHEYSRKVRMTDEEISCLVYDTFNNEDSTDDLGTILEHAEKAARDLRDRYESLGKYAPTNANAPAAQEVKS